MKGKYARLMIGILGLILVISGSNFDSGRMAWAQGAAPGASPVGEPLAPAVSITPTMSYQGKLLEGGSPVTGDRQMTFRLFSAPSGGAAVWTEGPKTIPVSNGLFTVTLGDTTALHLNSMAQKLYLEIEVASTLLPRQLLQGAPYALSLAPGAYVQGNASATALSTGNSGSGSALSAIASGGQGVYALSATQHGVYAQGLAGGLAGSALLAENLNTTNGIAVHAYNDSVDATMALSNDGSGDLLKGFGGDGGEDEFRFKNDGTFQDKAPSYLFIPGANTWAASGVSLDKPGSSVLIQPSSSGTKTVYLSGAIPAVMYGQPTEVEEIRVYYMVSDFTSYIDTTTGYFTDETGSANTYQTDILNHNSPIYASYALTPASAWFLSPTSGFFSVRFDIYFSSVSHTLRILGVRLKLRHHPLY